MFNPLRYLDNGNYLLPLTYPVWLPGDIADTLLVDQDPGYDIPLPYELQRWENEGGAS